MKKFFFTLLSLLIVVSLSFVDFNVLRIADIPLELKNLIDNGIELPTGDKNKLTVEQLNDNLIQFSFQDSPDYIKEKITDCFLTNGSSTIDYLDVTVGIHTTTITFTKGKNKEYRNITYEICPLPKKDVLRWRRVSNNPLIFPAQATTSQIEQAIKDSYFTNGNIELLSIPSTDLGCHTIRVRHSLNSMNQIDKLNYTISEDELYVRMVDSKTITLPFGATTQTLRQAIREKYETNGILILNDKINLNVGDHKVLVEFISPINNDWRSFEIEYNIYQSYDGVILSNPRFDNTYDYLTVSYKLTNFSGATIYNLNYPHLLIIDFTLEENQVVADVFLPTVHLSAVPNNSSTTVTFQLPANSYDSSYSFNLKNPSSFLDFSF